MPARDHRVHLAPPEDLTRRDESQRRGHLKELERENAQLTRIVANRALDIDVLEYAAEVMFRGPTTRHRRPIVQVDAT